MRSVSGQLSVPTGLLSDKQRAFLRGEREGELKNPEQYERQLRSEAGKRAEVMAEDLDLLEEHGHGDIVARFYHEVDRIERLRRALDERDTREEGQGP